jgi:hypothetical protein
MNKIIAEYNWSVQEVCYQLFDIPLCKGSRNVVILDCQQENNRSAAYEFRARQLDECKLSAYKKYKYCLDKIEDNTFLDFLLNFNHTNYKHYPRT